MTTLMTKTLEEILNEGIKLVPIFSDHTCSSFKVGFYYDGVPHAIWKDVYEKQEECQGVIDCMLSQCKQ
jgi:hypothetical protein